MILRVVVKVRGSASRRLRCISLSDKSIVKSDQASIAYSDIAEAVSDEAVPDNTRCIVSRAYAYTAIVERPKAIT